MSQNYENDYVNSNVKGQLELVYTNSSEVYPLGNARQL